MYLFLKVHLLGCFFGLMNHFDEEKKKIEKYKEEEMTVNQLLHMPVEKQYLS